MRIKKGAGRLLAEGLFSAKREAQQLWCHRDSLLADYNILNVMLMFLVRLILDNHILILGKGTYQFTLRAGCWVYGKLTHSLYRSIRRF